MNFKFPEPTLTSTAQKSSFPLSTFSVNVTKSAVSFGFFEQCKTLLSILDFNIYYEMSLKKEIDAEKVS